MPAIPAYCSRCSIVFPSGFGAEGRVTNLTLVGCRSTCPKCGQMADVVDGVFNVADGLIEIVRAPDFTVDVLKAFQSLINKAVHTSEEAEAVAETAEELHPGLGDVVRNAYSTSGGWLSLIALLLILSRCVSLNFDVDLDINRLIDQVVQEQSQDIRDDKRQGGDSDTEPPNSGC